MNGEVDYGKRSYEYAIGAYKATSRQPLTDEQWLRLKNSDTTNAYRLLVEYGYPAVNGDFTVVDSIEKNMSDTVEFIRSNAPDNSLTDLLFFEEDALNLKMLIKAKRLGMDVSSVNLLNGSVSREILEICAKTEDFSLLGEEIEKMLASVPEITSPSELSCVIDSAMFAHSVKTAKKKLERAFADLLIEYGKSRNRLTALRLRSLQRNTEDYKFAFLPIEGQSYESDVNLSDSEILSSAKKAFDDILNKLDFDEGMGFIARYYFLKKNDASALRLLFAQKTLDGGDDNG